MRDLLRLLSLIVVDVLLDRVTLCQKVHDFTLVLPLLDTVSVNVFLGVHNLLALNVENMLASLQCSFKLTFLLLPLS